MAVTDSLRNTWVGRPRPTPTGNVGGDEDMPTSARHRAKARATHHYLTTHPLSGHVAPWPVTALLWAAAAAAYYDPQTRGVVQLVAPVVAVVWWWAWSRRRTREQRRDRRNHAALVTAAAASWLLWAMHTGPAGWQAVTLWLGMVVLMQPYWRRRRIPNPLTTPVATPMDVPLVDTTVAPEQHPVVTKWVERVQAPGGALVGAYLTGRRSEQPNCETWDVNLRPGQQTTDNAIGAHSLIVSALDHLTVDQVIVDRHPSGSMARAKLTVVQGHPLNRRLDHPGPGEVYNPETGYAAIGMHPDEQPAEWGLCVPNWGLTNGFVVGGIGSGKSTLMMNVASIAAHTGIISVWAGCPVGGQSFPALVKHATWPATTVDEIILQLEAAAKLIQVRGVLNNLRGQPLHMPSVKEPGVLLFIDEFHKLTRGHARYKEAVSLLDIVTREGRKAAVAIVGADQDCDLQGVFGGEDTLRTSMIGKNLSFLRTPSKVTKDLVPGVTFNPATLPERFPDGSPTSGLGYMVGQRNAPYRGWFTPDAEQLLAGAPKVELDQVGARGIGAPYMERELRRTMARAAQAAVIQKLDPEALRDILESEPDLRAALELLGPVSLSPLGPDPTQAHRFGPLHLVPAPQFVVPGEDEQPVSSARPVRARDKVLGLVRDGVRRKGELVERSGLSETAVRNALNELVAEGVVANPKHGDYVPVDGRAA